MAAFNPDSPPISDLAFYLRKTALFIEAYQREGSAQLTLLQTAYEAFQKIQGTEFELVIYNKMREASGHPGRDAFHHPDLHHNYKITVLNRLAEQIESQLTEVCKWDVYDLEERFEVILYRREGGVEYLAKRAFEDLGLSFTLSRNPSFDEPTEFLARKEMYAFAGRINDSHSIDDIIRQLGLSEVVLPKRDSTAFPLYGRVLFRSSVRCLSPLDENRNVVIDWQNWAITLVDSIDPETLDPFSWGGHAVILIEGIVNQQYVRHSTDLIAEKITDPISLATGLFAGNVASEIRYFHSINYPVSFANGFYQDFLKKRKSETWPCTLKKIQQLLANIRRDRESHQIFYDPKGAISDKILHLGIRAGEIAIDTLNPFSSNFLNLSSAIRGTVSNISERHNCMSWCRKQLRQIGIDVPFDPSALFVDMPNKHTESIPQSSS